MHTRANADARLAGTIGAVIRVHDRRGLPCPPKRNPDASFDQATGVSGSLPLPFDDSSGLVHHEAQRGFRDGPRLLARVFGDAPLRPGISNRRLERIPRRSRAVLGGSHGLRRGQFATQCWCSGRVRGVDDHPGVPRGPQRIAPEYLLGANLSPRHQPGLRRDGGYDRGPLAV